MQKRNETYAVRFVKGGCKRPFARRTRTCAMPERLRIVRTRLALTLPHTSLFIQVLKGLERKIDGKLRSATSRLAASE
jgi:hypothetical protein